MNRYLINLMIYSILSVLTTHFIKAAPTTDFTGSIAYMEVTYSNPSLIQPWQKNPPLTRSGQAIAVGPNHLVTIASVVRNYDLIQIQPSFQTNPVEAKVLVIDYDVNLCLLEVPSEELEIPFTPVKFNTNLKLYEKLSLTWLSKDRRILSTQGRIEHPDIHFNKRRRAGFMYFQISSETAPGGYSEPATKGKYVLGLISFYNGNKQQSTLLPANVIMEFLKRTKLSPYVTVPKAGFSFSTLESKSMRSNLQIPVKEKRGVYISDVHDFGTGSDSLEKGDVLLSLGEYDIDPLGVVIHKKYGKLPLWFIISEYEVGKVIEAKIWRKGQYIEEKIESKTFDPSDLPVPYFKYDTLPEYMIQGGFIFQELNYDYMTEFGTNWESYIDPLIYDFQNRYSFHRFPKKKRLVILNHVLYHPSNQGYQHLKNLIVTKINNKWVKDLKHMIQIFSNHPSNGYFIIEFEGINMNVVLPAETLKKSNEEIKILYSIPELFRIG